MLRRILQVIVGLMIIAAVVCNRPSAGKPQAAANPPTALPPVEVNEYQGEKLSAPAAFRENSISGPQHVDKNKYRLKITGLVDSTRVLTYDEVLNNHQHYHKVVKLNCVEGWSVNILWDGVLVRDLLKEACIKPAAKVVILHAYDGYTTSFPVDYLLTNDIMMAFNMNGVPLRPGRGFPFELVAENKWGYKWIKWITEIELSDDVNYRGYWESRGYSNTGNLKERFFEP